MNKRITFILSTILIVLGASARLFPHPANVVPISAIALFAGLYLPKRLAYAIPPVAMFMSDAIIGFYHWQMMATVYAGFIITVYFGTLAQKQKKIAAIVGATLAGSIIFFLLTNAAVWAFGTMYPHTLSGLGQSYFMAIPFFRNSLIGDLFYTGILIGGMELVRILQTHLSRPSTTSV